MSQSRNRPSKAPHKAGGVATNASAYAHSIASESQAEGEGPGSGNVELENQFILRLPTEPARALREALRSGAGNIKERLSIQLEHEKGSQDPRLRRGIIEFDGWNMHAKVVDLPTIIESQKTIDRKTFYKTADISQIVICREGEPSDEEDAPVKPKKYDPNKVEKKYLYPHGICPPLKNCRKRRFRKTMKKKYIEAPEIEKEVRRLFRGDNEAVSVKWELMTQEQLDSEKPIKHPNDKGLPPGAQSVRVAGDDVTYDESELFGALSDSDEDGEGRESGLDSSRGNAGQSRIDVDDSEGDTSFGQPGSSFRGANDDTSTSHMVQENSMDAQSMDNSMQMGSSRVPEQHSMNSNSSSHNVNLDPNAPTSFRSDMFPPSRSARSSESDADGRISQYNDSQNNASSGEDAVALKMQQISGEIEELQRQKREVQANIASGASNNAALLQRFRSTLTQLEKDIKQREEEQDAFSMFN